jgi:hypothetical protein
VGEKDKKEQQELYESDQARFGMIENIKDLEPEKGVGPHIATHERERLMEKDSSVGYFEVEGGSKGGLGAPLHLGGEIMKDGSPAVAQYQAGYNSYAQPLRKTYRAMGRLKDLSMTNAPLTPADVEKDPKLAAHFKNLKLDGAQDETLTGWSSTQSNMVTNIKRFAAGQHVLAGAMANYARVQKGLEAKRKQAERESKLAEIHQVDEVVKTVHEIMNVATEAWTFSAELDTIIGGAALDENAAFGEDEPNVEDEYKGKPNWSKGTVEDPSGGGQSVSTKKQKAAGKVDSVMTGTAEAQKIVADLKTKLAAGQTFDLGIDGVLTAIVGGKAYLKLKQDVAVLDAKIRKLGLDAEADDLTSATEALNGFKMSFSADRAQLKNDRADARNYARNFATKVGAGHEGIMAMYAAEAYQELAAFGQLANQEREDLMPAWGQAHHYIRTTNKQRFQVLNMVSDGHRLAENLGEVMEQRNYFHKHLPQWTATAKQWNDFFGKNAHHDLVRKDNAADKAED